MFFFFRTLPKKTLISWTLWNNTRLITAVEKNLKQTCVRKKALAYNGFLFPFPIDFRRRKRKFLRFRSGFVSYGHY